MDSVIGHLSSLHRFTQKLPSVPRECAKPHYYIRKTHVLKVKQEGAIQSQLGCGTGLGVNFLFIFNLSESLFEMDT